jgi:hypothetical protein
MKTFTVELQRIHSMSHHHGMVQARVAATVQAAPVRADDVESSSVLSMSVDNARVLFLLLKAQLAEVDARKGRSQR